MHFMFMEFAIGLEGVANGHAKVVDDSRCTDPAIVAPPTVRVVNKVYVLHGGGREGVRRGRSTKSSCIHMSTEGGWW